MSIDIFKQILEHNYNARDVEQLNVVYWMKRYINYYIEQERIQKQLKDTIAQIKTLKTLDEYKIDLSVIKEHISIMNLQLSADPESDVFKKELKALVSKEKKILSDIKKHETLPAKKSTLESRLTKIFNVDTRDRKIYLKVLTDIYMADEHLTATYLKDYSPTEAYLIRQYLLSIDKPFNTFIIDEAQDYSIVELELLRLQVKRVVLTGDILQNIQVNDLEKWEDIFNVYEVFGVENKAGDSELNIFNLKHNFRQTYQLANASFNFRQLLLESSLEDIEKEYYTSEKEFNGIPYSIPLLKYISSDKKLKQYFDEKIEHIKNTYSSKIPIALIYKDSTEKAKYEGLLKYLKLSSNTNVLKNLDLFLVDILEAKGKEFPVVVCNIDNMTDNEIYLIMTRAQFELDFITSENECTNKKIKQLVECRWIAIDGIDDFVVMEEILDETEGDDISFVDEGESKESSDKAVSKTIVEKIIDHEGDVTQTVDELEPAIIFDEQKYKDTFLEQLSKQQIGTQRKEIIFIEKEVDRDAAKIHNEIKSFLYETYKGYCQSCGFTFRKTNDHQNSFEKFNWSDKRIVKVNKSFVSSAESLCLCRNCVANIKFGFFEPVFIQKILDIESFEIKSFDEIITSIHNVVEEEPPEIFEDHTEFNDMFALEIKLNDQDRNLYFTKEHLMQFIIYLQLDKKIEIKNIL